MTYYSKQEILDRIHRRWAKGGMKQEGPIALHKNTRCRLEGFVGVGPLYQGKHDMGISWFDIRAVEGSNQHKEIKQMVKEVCEHLSLHYEEL